MGSLNLVHASLHTSFFDMRVFLESAVKASCEMPHPP